ncbi:uncharacterized protein B0H64DRAFT_50573 [Chaetomium fimeti]|uniref:Uncharacterized protein n=1 Tax=Chaetomium fimeti TaxID=1854472 RepID=A0AAE0H6Y9_9PEZI|nr:hypothetical protein B0H64DRAFT_50573 [Chaetomium fimeti]
MLPCRPGTNQRALDDDVRNLAKRLKRADPLAFGLLNCKGAMRVFKHSSQVSLAGFDLVFKVPDGTDPKQVQSLRAVLLLPQRAPSLSWRARDVGQLCARLQVCAQEHES